MEQYLILFELIFFFVGFGLLLHLGSSINFAQYFKKGKIKEMQLLYFIVIFILAYLLSSGLTRLVELSYEIIS